ncbi:MAG TPA: hypothetical protein DGT23_32450 [Micromonosporaceae bacterium]|nr:hypothetical protein [Micromonosporaceae bacterium]
MVHLEVLAKGRAALLAGEVRREVPPTEQPGQDRWGISMLLRPDHTMLATLTEFAADAAAVAGQGHWAHGPELLHVSLRALAPYRLEPETAGYGEALAEAAAGLAPITATVKTVSPHPLGIGVHVHPHDDTLDRLYGRLGPALHKRGLEDFEYWTREMWYINAVHFAADVNVEALVNWCDERRDTEFGTMTLSAVELVRYEYTGTDMRAVTLHKQLF